ncbi:MAG: TonB-dependent receptor [Bacteroidota bacterium]
MKRVAYIIFFFTIVAAEENADSSKSFRLDEVMVTSTRFVQDQKTSPLQYSVIDKHMMQSFNANSLADILKSVEGVMMKQYAGNSGIKTISQRGMGSEHTVVLLNGMRISVAQNSLLDFGLFDIESFDAVEVVSGGSSSLYGADAVAGAVNIITRTSNDPSTIELKYGIGSFGQRKYVFSGGMHGGHSGFRIGFVNEAGREDYPFTMSFGPSSISSNRQNADFTSNSVYALADGFISDHLSYTLYSSWFGSEKGVPGVFVSSSNGSEARQKDEDAIVTGGFTYAITDSITFNAQLLTRYFYERYLDPLLVVGNIPEDNYFVNFDTRLNSSFILRGENGLWNIGGEFARIAGRGNSLLHHIERNVASGFATYERNISVGGMGIEKIVFLPSVRIDAITKFPAIVSPSAALSLVFSSFDLSSLMNIVAVIRASVSRNYAAPTFNQLYYNGGGGIGNPDVQPERGVVNDIGGSVYFDLLGTHEVRASYFRIHLNDRVVWVAAGANNVTPKNIRETESKGVEVRYRGSLLENLLRMQVGYTSMSAQKIAEDFPGDPNVGTYLVYVPSEIFTSSVTLTVPIQSLSISSVAAFGEIQRIGFRYVTEDNSRFLPSVTLLNMNVKVEMEYSGIDSFCKFEINNLTNQQYQILASYPMPGRSFRFSAGVRF